MNEVNSETHRALAAVAARQVLRVANVMLYYVMFILYYIIYYIICLIKSITI